MLLIRKSSTGWKEMWCLYYIRKKLISQLFSENNQNKKVAARNRTAVFQESGGMAVNSRKNDVAALRLVMFRLTPKWCCSFHSQWCFCFAKVMWCVPPTPAGTSLAVGEHHARSAHHVPRSGTHRSKNDKFLSKLVVFCCERLPKRSRIEVRKTKSSAHSQFDKLEFSMLFLGEMLWFLY